MSSPVANLPYLTEHLEGIGGVLRERVEDFEVEEVPAYEPTGDGDHIFCLVEKRDLTSWDVVNRLGSAVGVASSDIGLAGMKDRRAITRQWLSLPPPITVEEVRGATIDGVKILRVVRHGHKLRTGHLDGNRFRIVIRQLGKAAAESGPMASATLAALSRVPGCPNWFGAQRFGNHGDNADFGELLVSGKKKLPKGRQRRLLLSAFQSQLFNEYLAARMRDGLVNRVVAGDLLQKVDTGGLFFSTDPTLDQTRFDAGEVVITGPIFGHKLRRPPAETQARDREQAVLDAHHIDCASFKHLGKIAQGTRRALCVTLKQAAVEILDDSALAISFALPKGSYATAVMRELIKGPSDFPN